MAALAAFTVQPGAPRAAAFCRPGVQRSGARVWDDAGTARIDFDMGGGSILLGHTHPRVEAAVSAHRAPETHEAIAVEALAELAPCAEAARFCAEESQALPAAIGAARALTGRRRAAVFGDAAAAPIDLDDLAALVVDALGATPAHLAAAASLANSAGAVLILDEGASSFRVHERGAQGLSGVVPHLSVFGAAIANGRPIGAVAGHSDLIAGLDPDDMPSPRPDALAAAGATLQRLIRDPVANQLAVMGAALQAEVTELTVQAAADRFFCLSGDPCLPLPVFASPQLEGLWLRECARAGLICVSAHGLSAAHTEADLGRLVRAYRTALPILAANGLMAMMARTPFQSEPKAPVFLKSGVS